MEEPVAPIIDEQPVNVTVEEGDMVYFTVKSSNADSIQWQIDTGSGFVNQNTNARYFGTTTETMSFEANEARSKFSFRAVLTNAYGSTISDEVSFSLPSAPIIDEQPISVTVEEGDMVYFTVKSSNADSIQWQINTGSGFVDQKTNTRYFGTTTETFSFEANEARSKFSFRAVLTNAYGSTISDEVTFSLPSAPIIDEQPISVTVEEGDMVYFTVKSSNADSIQWQINTGSGFADQKTNSRYFGTTTETFSFEANEARSKFSFRAILTNAYGSTISDEVTFSLPSAPIIDEQPISVNVKEGDMVYFTVKSSNADSIQWQINTGSGFVDQKTNTRYFGTTTETFSFEANEARSKFSFRAVLTNAYGSTISDEVTFSLPLTVNDVVFENITDTTLRIVAYKGNAATLVIDETINGMTVSEVGPGAFEGKTSLVSIDLPDTITIIGRRAFAGCSNLSEMK